jgi:hypothetical protein
MKRKRIVFAFIPVERSQSKTPPADVKNQY